MAKKFMISEKVMTELVTAQSAAQVEEILKEKGYQFGAGDAEHVFQEIDKHRGDMELSLDELDSISGGYDRDWLSDGCAASVEPGSWCGSNDYCHQFDVTYKHMPTDDLCPRCGSNMYIDHIDYDTNPSDDTYYYRCKTCGYLVIH